MDSGMELSPDEEIGKLYRIQKALREEITGPALAAAVTKSIGINLSELDILVLAQIRIDYLLEHENVHNIPSTNIQLPSEGLVELIQDRLKEKRLIENVPNSGYNTSKLGEKVLDVASELLENVVDAVQKDAFFGWVHRELNDIS